MGKTDKEWRLPAGQKKYTGKITMMEVRTLLQESEKDKIKPETVVDNSGEFANIVSSEALMEGKVMSIKAENGGKAEVKVKKTILKNEKYTDRG